MMTAPNAPHRGVFPGMAARLMVPESLTGRLDFAAEQGLGTYVWDESKDWGAELAIAGLQGRGGAGFPAAVKWQSVANATGHKVVVANGEEGEPASYKDRWLLTHRPHLVLDGLLLAARSVGAARAIVYLSHSETVDAIRTAVAELEASLISLPVKVEIHVVKPTYVAGEETSVCRSINGGPALPTARPPRPFERGVDNAPTLVSNVETLAHAAWIMRHGGQRYRELGSERSPGTTMVTLTGACHRPGVYEVPLGTSIDALFKTVGGGYCSEPQGFAVGGWFGGLLSAKHADRVCCYSGLRELGSGLGCGAITVLGQDDDPVAFAAQVAAWYSTESARQCGVCVKGTAAIASTLQSVQAKQASLADRDSLVRWGTSLTGRGACAFLDGAATLARSLMNEFGDAVDNKILAANALPNTPCR